MPHAHGSIFTLFSRGLIFTNIEPRCAVACGNFLQGKKTVGKILERLLSRENPLKTHPKPGLLEEPMIFFCWHRPVWGVYHFLLSFFAFNHDVVPRASFPGLAARAGGCHIPCVPWLVSHQTHRFRTEAAGAGLGAGVWSCSVFSGRAYLMHVDLIHF